MIEVRHRTSAPAEAVWDVLCDGWLYASWVVGASRVRGVDEGWPAVGTKLHHSVGLWPALIDDETEVLDAVPGRRLRLQARGWPAGEATVDLQLFPAHGGDGCVIVIGEDATKGPGRFVPFFLRKPAIVVRNRETMRRLAMLAEGRAGDAPRSPLHTQTVTTDEVTP